MSEARFDAATATGITVHPRNCGPAGEGVCADCEKAAAVWAKWIADFEDATVVEQLLKKGERWRVR